jgi:hypothetical protein
MMRLAMGLLAGVLATACAEAQPANGEVTVAVMRDGRVEVNGRTTEDIVASLRRATDGTPIAYYREGGDSEPTERQTATFYALMETAAAKRMPIRLSATPDFSTSIDDQGRVVPQ